MLWNK